MYGTLPFHTDTVVHGASKDEKRQLLKEKSRQRKAQQKQNSSESKSSSLNPTPEPGSVQSMTSGDVWNKLSASQDIARAGSRS